jgi:hypothetical protein
VCVCACVGTKTERAANTDVDGKEGEATDNKDGRRGSEGWAKGRSNCRVATQRATTGGIGGRGTAKV